MYSPIVNPGGGSVNRDLEPPDERDDDEEFRESWDDGEEFRLRQEDERIEVQRRQDAQVSRAAAEWLTRL